jgi:tetratricopeptide (TPR) repeat protein
MPFDKRICWRGLSLALCALAGGCATPPPAPPAAAPAEQVTERGAARPSPAAPSAAAKPAPAPAPKIEVAAAVQLAFERAVAALAAGRSDEAEQGFLALTKSNPELGGPFANLGLIYRRAGKLEPAAAQLEQAVRASPGQAVYLNQLGIVYREQGRFADARRAYEQAIDIAPEYAAPQLNLGILLDLYLWDSPGALAAYERYLALSPEGDEKVRKWVAEIRNRKPPAQLAGVGQRP